MPEHSDATGTVLDIPGFLFGIDHAGGAPAGECRYCGCGRDYACQLEEEPFACSWYQKPNHRGLGVCSNPECVKKYLADPGAP